MDAKITKKRLSHLLSYDWLKIIGVAVAGILVWSLIFTMTATRIRASQKFTVFNYTSNVGFSSTYYYDEYQKILGEGVFSAEVIETGEYDLTTPADMASTMLETRLATDECNVMFIANTNDESTAVKDEQTGETSYKTYLESFSAGGFGTYMADVRKGAEYENGFFQRAEKYLNNFYTNWEDENTLDKGKVEEEFLARAKKNKDKRFKTDEQKQKGIKQDIERIEKYRDALANFYAYLDAGYVSITEMELDMAISPTETMKVTRSAINLCPNEDTMGDLKKIVNYQVQYKEGETEKEKSTAQDMHLILFDLKGVESGFEFESLLFVENLVRTYCSELQN